MRKDTFRAMKTEGQILSDLIKREDAIDAFQERWARTIDYNGTGEDLALECEEVINNIPSAGTEIDSIRADAYVKGIDSERKRISDWCRPQGEWIKNILGIVICSECKRPRRDNRVNHINFCNSCGARMKGGRR